MAKLLLIKYLRNESMKIIYSEELAQRAQSNNSEAQYQIGNCYHYGKGIDFDFVRAFDWYEKAAKQGHPRAQCNLACLYNIGDKDPKNAKIAWEWMLRSAEQNFAPAQTNLGIFYQQGNGVMKDNDKAIEWFTKASENGDLDGIYHLGYILLKSSDQHNANHKKALTYLEKAAKLGHAEAQFCMGVCYSNQVYLEPNQIKSLYWFELAALQDHPNASFNTGLYYYYGNEKTSPNKETALSFFEKAANSGHQEALQAVKSLKEELLINN